LEVDFKWKFKKENRKNLPAAGGEYRKQINDVS